MNQPATARKEQPVKSKGLVQLKPSGLLDAAYGRRIHYVQPTSITDLEDVLKPEYWAHVSRMLLPGSKIELLWEDFSKYAELLVLDTGPTWAKVTLLPGYPLDLAEEKKEAATARSEELKIMDEKYEVVYKGPTNRWSVVRKQDGEYLFKHGQQKEDAQKFLLEYQQAMSK